MSVEPILSIRALSEVVNSFEQPECTEIIRFLLGKKCILKYGNRHESISDILRCCFNEINEDQA